MHLQKLNGPGLKCEVGVCINAAKTIWPNGPFVGSESNGRIFRDKLSMLLCVDKAAEVDHGCEGDDEMKMPSLGFNSEDRKMKSNVRAQHEAVNDGLKQFGVLTAHF